MSALALYVIGAPRCGKTAVFDALTHTPEGPNFMVRGGNRFGTVKVPDLRLEALRDLFQPKKFTPAEVTFADVAPKTGTETLKFGDLTAFLANADAFVLVVQAFGEFDFEGKPVDPAGQLESVLLELVVADLEKVERRLERMAQDVKRGTKASPQETALLERIKEGLGRDVPLRDMEFREDEEKLLRTYQFLSQKPLVVVANVSEDMLGGAGLEALARLAGERKLDMLRFCAPLETEIAGLDAASQTAFLKDYGMEEPARVRLIQAAYRALRLISFFTVGEDEVRAWTIMDGTGAQAAAGKIHSDIERGFIRAETVCWSDLKELGTVGKCREHNKLRLEGKEYVVRDGDVINFRFSA